MCLISSGVKEKKADKKKTKVVKKNLNPEWNETLTFDGITAADLTSKRLYVSLRDWDRITANDFMGSLSWSLEEVQDASFSTSGCKCTPALYPRHITMTHQYDSSL